MSFSTLCSVMQRTNLANKSQRMGSRSVLSRLLGLHPLHDELDERRPAQVWPLWRASCDLAPQWYHGAAHPLLEVYTPTLICPHCPASYHIPHTKNERAHGGERDTDIDTIGTEGEAFEILLRKRRGMALAGTVLLSLFSRYLG